MKHLIKIGLIFLTGIFFTSATLSSEKETPSPTDLKSIMQGMLSDTKDITEGIFIDNFEMIEKAANNIAMHPEIPPVAKLKLIKAFGPKMQEFKANDMKVHQAAVEIGKAAQLKDMDVIITQFHVLIDGCGSCHGKFKKTVQEILK
ncbi:MAG: hypothetical protein COA74_11395 [Gammaproteobacteria bacterium]|nr:MAG: hypothetical protein COA74_11395 [Gammaproteobacteria bacterium]